MAFPLLKKPHTINMTDCLMISGPFLLSDRHFYQQYGGFLKWGYPQIVHFSRIFQLFVCLRNPLGIVFNVFLRGHQTIEVGECVLLDPCL